MTKYIDLTKLLIEGFKDKNYGYLARELNKNLNRLPDHDAKGQKKLFTEIIMQVFDHFDVGIKEAQKQVAFIDDIESFFKKYQDRTNFNGDEKTRLVMDLDKEIQLSELNQEYKELAEAKVDLEVLISSLEQNEVIDYKLIDKEKSKAILERWKNEKGN